MLTRTIRAVVLVASAALGLSACSTNDGYGYGGGYYRGGYGLSDGGPFYGWYDNHYYPERRSNTREQRRENRRAIRD